MLLDILTYYGIRLGVVDAHSKHCAETQAHVATSLDGKRFVYNHEALHHTLVETNTCSAVKPYKIASDGSLYQFLYTKHDCSHGQLATDISIGIDFYTLYTDSYPTISSEKILDGNHCTIKPSTFTHGASNEMYLFKTDSSLTLHNLTVSGFISDPSLTIIDSTGPYLGISGCTFSNNTVYQHIFVEASNNVTDICNSLFQDVTSSRVDSSGGGGAITSMGQTLSIYDSSFIRNSSSSDGGAIKHNADNGILTLSGHNYFRDNSCGGEHSGPGGAIASWSHFLPYAVQLYGKATFSGNRAYGGGACFLRSSGISLSKGPYEFSGNHANGGPGGAIYSGEITISAETGTSTFTNNYADGSGGALYALSGGIILDGSFSFVDNSAGYGGALFTETSGISLSKGPYEFSGNRATDGEGGAIYSNNEITISADIGSTFTKNYAKISGGALYAATGAIRLDGSFSFVDNSSTAGGGALCTPNSGITLLKGPYEFSGNRATGAGVPGGAIFSSNEITISADIGTFTNNHADGSGGALCAYGTITLGGSSSFVDNTAAGGGGALTAKNITLNGSSDFSGNISDTSGGAIFAHESLIIDSSNITFNDNTANDGSNIYIEAFNPQTSFITSDAHKIIFVNKPTLDTSRAMLINNINDLSNFIANDSSHVGVIRTSITNYTPTDHSFNKNKTFYGSVQKGQKPVLSGSGGSTNPLIYSNSGDVHLYNLDVSGFVNTGTGAIRSSVAYTSKNDIHIHSCDIHDNSGTCSTISSSKNIMLTGSSSFSNNHVAKNGGALYALSGDILLEGNSTFTKNTAGEYGGALYALSGGIILDGSFSFVDNSAQSGGALFTETSGISLSKGPYEFTGNRANGTNGLLPTETDGVGDNRADGDGGAIYSKNLLTISAENGSTFTKNYAKYSGGALCAYNYGIILDGSFSFVDNSTGVGGGGALNADPAARHPSSITLLTGPYEFTGNHAPKYGGAICSMEWITISAENGSTFTKNYTNGEGGALFSYVRGGIILDGSFSFVDNSAGFSGGALCTVTSGISLLKGPYEFSGNRADGAGGAIASNNEITISAENGSTFTKNYAKTSGGALYAYNDAIRLDGSFSFVDNSAGFGGGALYTDYSGISLLTGPYEFSGNRADEHGGAISSQNDITISADIGTSTFTNNYADSSGGALYAKSGAIRLDGSFSFVDNSAVYGGALCTENSGISLSKGPYEFSGNRAGYFGGAIYSNNEITISAEKGTSTFTNNHADGQGGALFAATGAIRLDGSFSFVDNSAADGGALYTGKTGISLSKGPYEFSGNRATFGPGGAIYSTNEIIISAEKGTFAHNHANSGGGGALYAHNDAIILDGSFSFVDNSAAFGGGALYTELSGISLSKGPYEFSGNHATNGHGGAIYSKNEITISADIGTFTNNYAKTSGGALYAYADAIRLDGSFSFVDNSAHLGGALFTANAGISLSTGKYEFSRNHADGSGEHIWAKTDICYNTLKSTKVTFTDPSCEPSGVWVDTGSNNDNQCPPH